MQDPRASPCPPCAETYRADTYQLIRAGLTGGKSIPATVAQHPCVFTTLTAPSFGPDHTCRERDSTELACHPRRNSRACPHGVRISCTQKHARDDDQLGEPLCPDCYDYTRSVLFNACAPELWRRFTITLRRTLRVHYQCFTTIDRGRRAASPWAASSDSAEAISASRPSRVCRQRFAAAGVPGSALGRPPGTPAPSQP